MKLILMIIFWVMVGYALGHFFGFWGVFGEILFIVFINLVTWDSQMKKVKEELKNR